MSEIDIALEKISVFVKDLHSYESLYNSADYQEAEAHQAFTSHNNHKGNADTELMMRTMKEELLWLREWQSSAEVIETLNGWIETYNREHLHSSPSYQSPEKFEESYNLCHKTIN